MREVVLKGGAPWGFRMTGGADQHHTLKISRVNPGSKAAEKLVREGDLIYRINGYDTANLSNQEAHILLRSCKDNLYLILNQKGKERRKETEIDLLQGWEHLDNIKNNTENPETEIKKDPELSEEEETAKQNYREDTKKENTQNEENKMEDDLKNIGKEEKSPLPLPATPESIFLKLFRERKLSNHSEDGDTSTLRSIHDSLFDQTPTDSFSPSLSSASPTPSSCPPTPSSCPPTPSTCPLTPGSCPPTPSIGSPIPTLSKEQTCEQQLKHQTWLNSNKILKHRKLKHRIISSLLEKDLKSKLPNERAELKNERCWSPEFKRKYLTSRTDAVGRIDDYLPTDDESSCTSTPCTVQSGNISTTDCTADPSTRTESKTQLCDTNKKVYLHEILVDGEGESNLVIRKSNKQCKKNKTDPNLSKKEYRSIHLGGDIPKFGLGMGNRKQGTKKAQKNEKEEVYIHYKTPILREEKKIIPEYILEQELEKRMMNVYEEMALNKIKELEDDYERRKHSDYRVAERRFQDYSAVLHKDETKSSHAKQQALNLRAKALYNFNPEREGELELKKGNLVMIVGRVDENWLVGEINGSKGLIPTSFIQIIEEETGLRLVAKYSFRSAKQEELTIVKGEIVQFERFVDENWVEVSMGERMGIVPVSYLDTEKEVMSWENEVLSLSSSPSPSPSTPERDKHPDVIEENVFRPSDLLKCKLRSEFRKREEKMRNLESSLDLEYSLSSLDLDSDTGNTTVQ